MKQIFPKLGMTVAMLLSFLPASAYDFEANGICYDITSSGRRTVEVNKYSGSGGQCDIPKKVSYDGLAYTVTSIGKSAFYDCSGLTNITIPNSVTSIGDFAFINCSGLTRITIPNSVTSIGAQAFGSCTGLTSVTIPNSVTYIGDWTFEHCTGLTSVTIPNSVTSIGDNAFYYCTGLKSITVPNSVTSIGNWALAFCTGLTSITLPNSVTSIGEYTFWNCKGLTGITIPNSVTSIGDRAFFGCTGLVAINVDTGNKSYTSVDGVLYNKDLTEIIRYPEGKAGTTFTIPSSVTSIEYEAFGGCKGLTSVTIQNSVTSIGNYAFNGCKSLTSITIPTSVTSIGQGAFQNCAHLRSVYCNWNEPITANDNLFESSCYKNGTLYVPKGCAGKYNFMPPWSNFWNIEESDNLGVEDILEDNPAGGYIVYDLQGVQRLKTENIDEVKQLPSGLYIVNGKKIMIR